MDKNTLNYYEKNLIIARKLNDDSCYEVFEKFFELTNTNTDILILKAALLGFDDNTEDSTYMYGLTHVIADIYKTNNEFEFFNSFTQNIFLLFPHALNWCRSLFSLWNLDEKKSHFFIEISKKNNCIDFVNKIYDLILEEEAIECLETVEIANVKKYKTLIQNM